MFKRFSASVLAVAVVGVSLSPLAAVEALNRPTNQQALELLFKSKPTLVSYTGEVNFTSKSTPPKNKAYLSSKNLDTKGKFTFSGYGDTRDIKHPKTYLTAQASFNDAKGSVEAGSLGVITLDTKVFLQVQNPLVNNFLSDLSTSSTPITSETWFKIDLDEIVKKTGGVVKNRVPDKLSAEQIKQLQKSISKNRPFTLQYAKQENVGTIPVYTYKVVINKGRILPTIREVAHIMGEKPLTKDEEKAIVKEMGKLKTLPQLTVSFRKDTLQLAQVTLRLDSAEKDSYGFTNTDTVTASIAYTYPKSIPSIQEPLNSVSVVELFENWKNKSLLPTDNDGYYDNYRLSDLKKMQTALELYYTDNNSYPVGTNLVLGEDGARCLNGQGWQASMCTNPYMAYVYKDPGTFSYRYTALNNGTSYKIEAELSKPYQGYSGKIEMTPSGIVQK